MKSSGKLKKLIYSNIGIVKKRIELLKAQFSANVQLVVVMLTVK